MKTVDTVIQVFYSVMCFSNALSLFSSQKNSYQYVMIILLESSQHALSSQTVPIMLGPFVGIVSLRRFQRSVIAKE